METQLTIRIPSKLALAVKKTAGRLGLKRSDIVRLALQRFVGKSPVDNEKTGVFDRVESLLGSVETGITDLGERHREHLLRKIKRHG